MSANVEKTAGVRCLWIVAAVLVIASIQRNCSDAQANPWNSIDPCRDPVACFGDKANVRVSDPEDCHSFFICINTSLIPSSCPKNKYYDYTINNCIGNDNHCQEKCTNESYKTHIVYETTVSSSPLPDKFPTSPNQMGSSARSASSTNDTFGSSEYQRSSLSPSSSSLSDGSASYSSTSGSRVTDSSTEEANRTRSETTAADAVVPITPPTPNFPTVSVSTAPALSTAPTSVEDRSSTWVDVHVSASTASSTSANISTVPEQSSGSTVPPTTKSNSPSSSTATATAAGAPSSTSSATLSSTTSTKPPTIETIASSTRSTVSSTTESISSPSTSEATTSSAATPLSLPTTKSTTSYTTVPTIASSAEATVSSTAPSTTTSTTPSTTRSTISFTTNATLPTFSSSNSEATTAASTITSTTASSSVSAIASTVPSSTPHTSTSPSFISATSAMESSSASSFASPDSPITSEAQSLSSSDNSPQSPTDPRLSSIESPAAISDNGTFASPSATAVKSTSSKPNLDSCNPPVPCRLGDVLADHMNCRNYFECVDSRLFGIDSGENRWTGRSCSVDSSILFDSVSSQCVASASATCRNNSCQRVVNHTVAMFPTVPIEGSPLRFVCSFSVTSVGYRVYVESMRWLLNGRALSPSGEGNGSDDIVIQKMALNATTGVSQSTLVFRSAALRYSGKVMCDVSYSQVYISLAESDAFDVQPLPAVQLVPKSVTVLPGFNVTLNCSAIANKDVSYGFGVGNITFEWFQNGRLIGNNEENVTIVDMEESSILFSQILQSYEFICRSRNGFGVSENQTAEVHVIKVNRPSGGADAQMLTCVGDREGGWQWPSTIANFSVQVPCHPPSEGLVVRQCVQQNSFSSAKWMSPDMSHCIDARLIDIWQQIADLENGIGSENDTVVNKLLTSIYNFTVTDSSNLTPGDYNSSSYAISKLLNIYSENPNSTFFSTDVDKIFESASALLNPVYSETLSEDWELDGQMFPPSVMKSVDNFGKQWSRKLQPGQTKEVIKSYLAVQVSAQNASQIQSLSYPQRDAGSYPDWMYSAVDRIDVERETLLAKKPVDLNAVYWISSTYYRTLASFFKFNQSSISSRGIDSRILSLSIDGFPSDHLRPEVQITLQHQNDSNGFSGNDSELHCGFWNFSIKPSGDWSTAGCQLNSSNGSVTICKCDHLTNFAILISPSSDILNPRDALILSTISLVGCIISIISLLLTIVVYAMRWKKLKSHQAVVLINLCVALIIANVIFLVGVNRTEPRAGCQVVSVLLHYFFLATFFLMLAEAFELLLYIVFVFHVRSRRETAALVVAAWGIPLIIVAISMGVSRMKGYGDSDKSCWLPPGQGPYWAFVGPALAIILVNIVIMIVVLCRVARIRRPSEKEGNRERVRATLWNIMVIAPVLGVAWVFGVFSVNNSLVVFQYIFAVANSLQGLFVFIFHALCNKRRVKARYSVRGQKSKQNEQDTSSSRGQRTSVPTSQLNISDGQRYRLDSQPTELSDDIIIIVGSATDERRPSEVTLDSHSQYRGHQAEIRSESSRISSSESSASSESRGESSDWYSCSTATTNVTHCTDDDEATLKHARQKRQSQVLSDL